MILALTLLAALASIGALGAELTHAKGNGGIARAGLAAGTVVLSWLFVQIAFAMHYAHLYYLSESQDRSHNRGLDFGYADEEPDYWDFVHFSVVTAQLPRRLILYLISRHETRGHPSFCSRVRVQYRHSCHHDQSGGGLVLNAPKVGR